MVFLHPDFSGIPDSIKAGIFDPDWLRNEGLITKELRGRGTTYFFNFANSQCVLKHYYRGGFISNISKDCYLWLGLKRTRAYGEWKILQQLESFGLPAPKPVAIRIKRSGLFYRGDIITEEIQHSSSIAEILKQKPLTEQEWNRIGVMIKSFHQRGVFHQDMNAMNILLSTNASFLIDFDRGKIRSDDSWKSGTLDRLQRSLKKLSSKHDPFYYAESHWPLLMNGYQSGSSI